MKPMKQQNKTALSTASIPRKETIYHSENIE